MMISELEEFFEGNSTSLEIKELYEDYCEDKSKKTALNAVRKELMKTYGNESELIIVLNMTLNWCALKSGFSDEKSREYLSQLNKETIQAVFEKNDAILIEKVIKSLLEMKPIKPKKEKPDYSNPGSKNWKKGDIFAYKLTGPEAEKSGIDGMFAIIYCFDLKRSTSRTNIVTAYLLLYFEHDLKLEIDYILDHSVFLPFGISCNYRYVFFESHDKYPTNKLTYLGNKTILDFPSNEHIYQFNELRYQYGKHVSWECFEKLLCLFFESWKKYGERHEKYKDFIEKKDFT